MKSYFEKQTKELYDRAIKIVDITQMLKQIKREKNLIYQQMKTLKKIFSPL